MTSTEVALDVIVKGIARDIDEDEDVAAGLLLMAAGRVASRHGIPREDIEEYAVDCFTPVAG